MNQNNSSNSKTSVFVASLIHRLFSFFYPIQHIRFSYAKNFPDASPAYAGIIDTYSLLLDFLRIFPRLSIERVFVFAVLAYTSLCSRPVISRIDLVFRPPAFRAATLFVYCLFSHDSILSHDFSFVKTLSGHSWNLGSA